MRKKKTDSALILPATRPIAEDQTHPALHLLDKPAPSDREMSQDEAANALRMLAAVITCDRDFIRVLGDADPALREEVYNQIRPFVGYPDPRPFALMSFD